VEEKAEGGELMNEKAIQKHISQVWKTGNPIIISRSEDGYLWISDINTLFKVPDKSCVFESRLIFPTLPEIGSGYRIVGKQPNETDNICYDSTIRVIQETIDNPEYKEAELTEWCHNSCGQGLGRLLVVDEHPIIVQQKYIDFLETDSFDIRFYATSSHKAVRVEHNRVLIALIMPVRFLGSFPVVKKTT
jgi:hypothetical protein